ncbi:MAG: sigma-70 family RNA polymerase sigma factor [Bryobacteraceae bacterium]
MGEPSQDERYHQAAAEYGAALERLARAYEFDPDRRRDLLQEIHLALWRSFALFDGRCSARTWVYRVAHNTAVSYGIGRRRSGDRNLVSLEEVELTLGDRDGDEAAGRRHVLARLTELIQSLKPLDRQVILSYLEGMDASAIGEITGLAAGNVATKIHRIKTVLAKRFSQGADYAE